MAATATMPNPLRSRDLGNCKHRTGKIILEMEGTKNSGAEDASEFFCWGLLGAFLSVLSAPIVNIVSTVIIVNILPQPIILLHTCFQAADYR